MWAQLLNDSIVRSPHFALGVGLAVTAVVFGSLIHWTQRQRRQLKMAADQDMPWEDLLNLLKARNRALADSGATFDDEMSPDQLLEQLLSKGPVKLSTKAADPSSQEAYFSANGAGAERRRSRRRWGSPTEVILSSPLLEKELHGLVINRSEGGLAIFVDCEVEQGHIVKIRAIDAPANVPSIPIEIRHSRKAGRNYLLGCQYRGEIPWNLRVWFG